MDIYLILVGTVMSLVSAAAYIVYTVYNYEFDLIFVENIKDIKLKLGPIEFTSKDLKKESPIIIVGEISSIERTIEELKKR